MKGRILSGIQPTGIPHLGNYIGAFKQFAERQKDYEMLIMIADLHAITIPQDPKDLKQGVLDLAATLVACGVDPSRTAIFIQSEVRAHIELGWIMGSLAKMGEMERMTQYKDKSKRQGDRTSLGLFCYPALQAADIVIYDATVVPVGEDQVQHVELTRTLARRFNEKFGETFVVPQALVQKTGARIMSLADPTKKMSKSDESKAGVIMLNDDAATIKKKIMRAVTDSGSEVVYLPEKKPALANLMTIYHHMSGMTMKEIETMYQGKGYGDFKKGLAEVTMRHLEPATKKLLDLQKNPAELNKILDEGRDAANKIAEEKIRVVFERMGLKRR